MRLANGLLIYKPINVYISTRCRAIAVETNVYYSENIFEIRGIGCLCYNLIEFSHQQILSLFARQFFARNVLVAHIEGVWIVTQDNQMPLELERGQQIVKPR